MTELIKTEALEAQDIFVETGVVPLIQEVRQQVAEFSGDVSTEQGRQEIASMAYKVARSKTAVDNLGKEYVAQIKDRAKVIDQQRKHFRDEMDALKAEIRKPLDEYERQIDERDKALKFFQDSLAFDFEPDRAAIEERKAGIDRVFDHIREQNSPYLNDVTEAYNSAIENLNERLKKADEQGKERKELERLREEEKQRQAEQEKEELQRQAAEKAAEQERQKIEQEEKRKAEEERKREADREHKKQVNNEILEDMRSMISDDISDDALIALITAIAKKQIRHTKITY